jgi:hypothetical protein
VTQHPSGSRLAGNLEQPAPRVGCALHGQRELLADASRWTRGAMARTLLKEAVVPLSDRALSWSLTGSLSVVLLELLGPRSSQVEWQRLYDATVAALWDALPPDHPRTTRKTTDLDGFNDFPGTSHDDILALIDRALDAIESD